MGVRQGALDATVMLLPPLRLGQSKIIIKAAFSITNFCGKRL